MPGRQWIAAHVARNETDTGRLGLRRQVLSAEGADHRQVEDGCGELAMPPAGAHRKLAAVAADVQHP